MNRSERLRLGWVWAASLALAALAGAALAWRTAPPAPTALAPSAFVALAVVAVALAVGLMAWWWSAAVVSPAASTRPRRSSASRFADASVPPSVQTAGERVHADTHPAVWSDTMAPGAAPGVQGEWAAPRPRRRPTGPVGDPSRPASAAPPVATESWRDGLGQALEAGEMKLVYQPVFHLEARQVHAVEALLRWPRANQALLPPEGIVAMADRGGHGAALFRFVLGSAAQQLVRWQQVLGTAAPARLCINLSRRQCRSDDLLDDFEAALITHGLQAEVFQFEMTERDIAADPAVEPRLHELRALGARIALDRFGEANASLAGLQRWPLDTVKVDGHLIRRAEQGDNARMVLKSTVDLAATLGLEAVAEGVETTSQLVLLRSLGCHLAQGHALCPPTDPFALTRRLRGGHWLAEAEQQDEPPSSASRG